MNSLWNTDIKVAAEGNHSAIDFEDSIWIANIDAPFEGDIKPFTGEVKSLNEDFLLDECYTGCSSDSPDQFSSANFEEEEYFCEEVLNPCGGAVPSTSSSKAVERYLIHPEIGFLDNVKDFEDRGTHISKLKPLTENRLIKIAHEREPFYESRQNLIIAQKRLDMHKGRGRLSFVASEIGAFYIDKGTEIRMFLRNVQTQEVIDLGLNVPAIDRCSCFQEHNRSLFCVRSKYEDAVKIRWTDDKLKALITVEDLSKFEILFAPLVKQRINPKLASVFLELVFEIENEEDIFQQSYFVKLCSYPSRDIESFIKKLVKECLLEESFLKEFKEPEAKATNKLFRVEIEEKYKEEFEQYLKTIDGSIAEFK